MRIAILGATGGTGMHLLRQALDQGFQVRAIVRTPSKLNLVKHRWVVDELHPNISCFFYFRACVCRNLEVVVGSIFSADSLARHFKNVDVVVSVLGFPHSLREIR